MGLFSFFGKRGAQAPALDLPPDFHALRRQSRLLLRTPAFPPAFPEVRAPAHRPGARIVRPDNTPFYLQRGWTQNGDTYHGWYRTKFGAYRGEIQHASRDEFRIFIFSPPMNAIDKHPKRACFQFRGGDKWYLNLYRQPMNGTADDCIRYVEQLLIEAHTGRFHPDESIF